MKLGIVIPGYQSSASDWCIPAFTNLGHELARHDEVHVFALRYPPVKRRYDIGPVHVHALGGGAFGGARLPVLSLMKLWIDTYGEIKREHNAGPLDALLGIWATESGWLAVQMGRLLGIPVCVHIAGGELVWLPDIRYGNAASPFERFLVNGSLRGAGMVTAPYEALIRRARGRVQDPGKVRGWALGVDTGMFSPLESRPHRDAPFTFVAVGSLIPVKDHAWLIRAFARLATSAPHRALRLKVAGSGRLRGELQVMVRELGLEGYVDLLGEVPHGRLPGLYRSADCFVLSSRHEAQCMAALEAMACGLPWVGPATGALADAAKRQADTWPSGILVRKRTDEALAEAMLRMVEAPVGLRAEMGKFARRRVESDYALQVQVVRLREILAELTHGPRVARIAGEAS